MDDLLGGLTGSGGGGKTLGNSSATTSIADTFGATGAGLSLGPLILAGMVTLGLVIIAVFAFRD